MKKHEPERLAQFENEFKDVIAAGRALLLSYAPLKDVEV
jgi:hypothetical protein